MYKLAEVMRAKGYDKVAINYENARTKPLQTNRADCLQTKSLDRLATKSTDKLVTKLSYRVPEYEKPIIKLQSKLNESVLVNKKPAIYSGTNTTSVKYIDNRTCTNSVTKAVELPESITALIDNKDYLPKHKKLVKDYGIKYQLKLAELAQSKDKPSHWFAKVTSKKRWLNQTLPMLDKLFAAIEQANKALDKLGISKEWLRYYTKVAYRTSEAKFFEIVEQALTTAKTTPQHYFKFLSTQV